MCLAIPARLVEYLDEDRMFGKVELGGVQRRVNTLLLVGPDACEPGDYVLVHVGFALSKVSEEEAKDQLRILGEMGSAYTEELQAIGESLSLDLQNTEGSMLSVSINRGDSPRSAEGIDAMPSAAPSEVPR